MCKLLIALLLGLACAAQGAHAQTSSVVLDCRKTRDSGTVVAVKGSELFKIVGTDAFLVWSDRTRPYSGGERRWDSWAQGEDCAAFFGDAQGSHHATFRTTVETYSATCELRNSAGSPLTRKITINRIDGTVTYYEHFEGHPSTTHTHACQVAKDPQDIPPPAAKF